MADNNTPTNTDLELDPSKNNADVAAKLKDQDISGKSMAPNVSANPENVLDAMMKEAESKASENDVDAQKTADEKAAADKKAADEKAAAEKDAADPAKVAEKAAAEKAAADKVEAEKKKAEDIFKDTPSLPPNASPKSAEAFATVKIKAAQEISAREAKIAELEAAKKELEAKVANPVPPEVEQELKSLREWRARLDVDIDPKFKEHDKTIDSAREFIYAQLKKSPQIGDDVIEKIKKLGGPDQIQMDKLFESLGDKTAQRLIESKLADIEHTKFNKEQAIRAAKENISGYMQERQKAVEAGAIQHNTDTEVELKKHLPKLDYLQKKDVPAGADEATKKAIAEHNASVDQTTGYVQAALKDDSPEMRAVMIIGMSRLLHIQPQLVAANARVADLEKQLKEATDKIAAFKGASVSRLRESAVPPGGKLPEAKQNEKDIFHTRATDALDKIAESIQAERARAAGNR
jgi:hypothetical protein